MTDWSRKIAGKPPAPGSVCWSYFPEVAGAPVKHPCLVLQVLGDEANFVWLAIALGQSHSKDGQVRKTYSNELVFESGNDDLRVKSLDNVKFSLAPTHVLVVPYTRDSFYVASGQIWPKIGSVNLEPGSDAWSRFEKIAQLTNLKETLKTRAGEALAKPKSSVDAELSESLGQAT